MEIKYRTQLGELLEHLGLKGDAAEIGVAEGRFSEVLINQPSITKLYMIDAWEHLDQPGDGGHPQEWHFNNWKEAQERVGPLNAIFLRGMSNEMIKHILDDSLVLSYIDGDHSFNGCFNDLVNVYPKVKTGGIISLHDYENLSYGVNKAVRKFLVENNYTLDDLHTTEEDGDLNMISCWFIKK